MAEEAKEAPKTEEKPAKGGLPIKTIGIIAVIMVIEAAAVFFIVGSTMKKPTEAQAHDVKHDEDAALDALVELPLVEDKFQNMQGGTTWIWDAAVYMKVKKRDEEKVTELLQARQAEIKEGIALVFRRAQPGALKEAGLETLNREISAFMNEIIEKAPDGTSRIQRIIIPKCRGFAAG
jgi:flagellar basal body-associated protein FliL